jgi:hypothetical protein
MNTQRRKTQYVTAEREVKVARISADQATVDRLQWCEAVVACLGIKTAAAVILRRALVAYVRELEKLLKRPADEDKTVTRDMRLRAEAVRIKQAAKGDARKLPDEALDAYPPKLFSEIEREARNPDAAKAPIHEPLTDEELRRG